MLVHPELPRKREALRYAAGAPILVTSGYRCLDCNRSVGGAENSYHTFGMAADIFVAGFATRQLAEMAEAAGFDGIGIYSEQSFIHVDVRGYQPSGRGKGKKA